MLKGTRFPNQVPGFLKRVPGFLKRYPVSRMWYPVFVRLPFFEERGFPNGVSNGVPCFLKGVSGFLAKKKIPFSGRPGIPFGKTGYSIQEIGYPIGEL